MSALKTMFSILKGSPVAVVGGAIVVSGSIIYTYKRVYEPYAARKRRVEAENIAEYIFRKEQQARGLNGPDSQVLNDR